MKLCAAQTKPLKGNIPVNIHNHQKLIHLAIANGVDFIVFPELSIIGYEPTLADELAMPLNDPRLNGFQTLSDAGPITIGIGMPLKTTDGITISMILFQPEKARETYSKQYLHADEEPYFVRGHSTIGLLGPEANIAAAICYELSVPEHSEAAHKAGAKTYFASVVKTAAGTAKAIDTLAVIAKTYSMNVVMANCVGVCDGEICGGRSSVWNQRGELLGQLNDTGEGILIIDTDTQEVIKKTL
ncbi:carbon-nitrogen hydrolase family protein [Runella slithyformis]|nr:carbon-nitrogen hydrolase family protein [Runella slithyformis]